MRKFANGRIYKITPYIFSFALFEFLNFPINVTLFDTPHPFQNLDFSIRHFYKIAHDIFKFALFGLKHLLFFIILYKSVILSALLRSCGLFFFSCGLSVVLLWVSGLAVVLLSLCICLF